MNRNKSFRIALIAAALLLAVGIPRVRASSDPDPKSGVEGTLVMSPIQGGPTRLDLPDSAPFPNATLVVEQQGRVLCTAKTDAAGKFRIPLAAGHYEISVKGQKRGIGSCGPFELDVAAGEMKQVQWQCDTGIR
jgi:hypothetical protein